MLIRLYIWLLLAAQLVAADGALGAGMKKVCENLGRYTSCKTSIQLPRAKVRYANQKWFKVNKCKTRYKFPFGGWTCVPGTDTVWVSVPVGIDISLVKYGTCDILKKLFGTTAFLDLANKSLAMCNCLPEVMSMLDKDTFKAMLSSTSPGEASGPLLAKFGDFAQCAADNGLNVRDNKPELSKSDGPLSTTRNALVFQAAEIDLSRYIAFVAALTPCFVGNCDPSYISGWFQTYLTDSEALMKDQLIGLLKPWQQAFSGIENNFQTVSTSAENIGKKINLLQADAAKIIDDLCPDIDKCASNTVKSFKKQVNEALDFGKEAAQLQTIVATTVQDAKAIATIVEEAIKAFEAVGDLNMADIVDAVVSGKFRNFEDLAGALKAAQKLPTIIDDIQTKLPQLNKIVVDIQQKGPAFVNSLQGVFTDNWLGDFEGDAATAEKMKAGIYELQQKMFDIVPQANELWNSISFLGNAIGSVATGKIGAVNVRVASYRRWTQGWFVNACLTTGWIEFNMLGFTAKTKYPKFYRCKQNYNVPFPNHHIPYIRIELPEDSPLLKMNGNNDAAKTSISWNGVRPGSGPTAAATSPSASDSPTSLSIEASSSSTEPSSPSIEPSLPPSEPSPPPSQITEPPSDLPSTITSPPGEAVTATAIRRRWVPFGKRQADGGDLDLIPPDPTVSEKWDAPTDAVADEGAASASVAAAASAEATVAYVSADGTTKQIATKVTEQPTATEVEPAPPQAEPTQVPEKEFGMFDELAVDTSSQDVITQWEDVKPLDIDMSEPTSVADSGSGSGKGAAGGGNGGGGGKKSSQFRAAVVSLIGVMGGMAFVFVMP